MHCAGSSPAPGAEAESDRPGGEPLRQDDPAVLKGLVLGRCAFIISPEGRDGEALRPAEERAGPAAPEDPEDRFPARPAVHLLRGATASNASAEPGPGGGPAGPPVGGRHPVRDVEDQGGKHQGAMDADRGAEESKGGAGEAEGLGAGRGQHLVATHAEFGAVIVKLKPHLTIKNSCRRCYITNVIGVELLAVQLLVLDPLNNPYGINRYRYLIETINNIKSIRKSLKNNDDLFILSKQKNDTLISRGHATINLLSEEDFAPVACSKSQNAEALRISKQWCLFGELPNLLDIGGMNYGEILQTRVANKLREIIGYIDIASNVIEQINPDSIRAQSSVFPIGKAFSIISSNAGLDFKYLESTFYARIKEKISLMGNQRWWNDFRRTQIFPGPTTNWNATRLLFDAPYVNYYRAILPIVDIMSSNQNINYWIIGKKEYIKSNNVLSSNKKNIDYSHYKYKKYLIKKYIVNYLANETRFTEIFTYRGMSLWHSIRDELYFLLDNEYLDHIKNQIFFKNAIDTIKPDAFIIGSESRSEGVVGHCLIAKNMGIPIIEVQHGDFSFGPVNANPISDIICVGGDHYRNMLIENGVPSEKIEVTGWPKFDRYVKTMRCSSERENTNSSTILFITQGIDTKLNFDCIREMSSYISNTQGARLVVKPHPMEGLATYEEVMGGMEGIILKKPTDDIAPLLNESDVVVLISSTVGIEAILMGKPIICLNIGGLGADTYIQTGIAIEVSQIDGLASGLDAALFDENTKNRLSEARERFIQRYVFGQGDAAKTISELIINASSKIKLNPNLDS